VYIRNIEARSLNHCFRGKSINIIYSECVSVALVIQYSMRKRLIFICGLSGSNIFFPTLSHTRHGFQKQSYWIWNVCFVLSTTFVRIISHFKKNAPRILQMNVGLHVQCPLFLSQFNQTWNFGRYSKTLKYQISLTFVKWKPEVLLADRQTRRN
jgi:hypothetical protein